MGPPMENVAAYIIEEGLVLFNNPCMENIWTPENEALKNLSRLAIIGSLPDTLEEYLSWVISKTQPMNRITHDKLYPLYRLMVDQPFQVEYSINEDGSYQGLTIIVTEDSIITADTVLSLLPDNVKEEISGIDENIIDHLKYISFGSNGSLLRWAFNDLFKMHRFFFPLRYQSCF